MPSILSYVSLLLNTIGVEQMGISDDDNMSRVTTEVTKILKEENSRRMWRNITTWLNESGEEELRKQLQTKIRSLKSEVSDSISKVEEIVPK